MLAILQIKMYWTKDSRNPAASASRQKYYEPVAIEADVPLTGEGIFVKKCNYRQDDGDVSYDVEVSEQLDRQLNEETMGKAFTGSEEHEQKMARYRNQGIQRDKGAFYQLDQLDIPCVAIQEEAGKCYRVKWFDDGRGLPKRRGGNEDFRVKGAKLAGRPNSRNETAFVLQEGESGILKYNYRCTYYCGQWYECYYVYVVNTDVLSSDVFIRDYTYCYDQLADLF